MSLANKPVRKLLDRQFVPAWVNTEGDAAAGGSFAHAPGSPAGSCVRGNGRANLQMLVLTPDGRIFHALAGFADAAALEAELRYALETWSMMLRTPVLTRELVAERARSHARAPLPEEREESLFARHARRAVDTAKRFVARHPLLPVREFRTAQLGGGGASFFGSSSGGRPGDTIGRAPADLPKLPRRRRPDDEEPVE